MFIGDASYVLSNKGLKDAGVMEYPDFIIGAILETTSCSKVYGNWLYAVNCDIFFSSEGANFWRAAIPVVIDERRIKSKATSNDNTANIGCAFINR